MSEPRTPYLSGDGMPVWDYKPDPDEPLRVILARIERKLDRMDMRVQAVFCKIDAVWLKLNQSPHFDVPIKPADDGWNYSHDRDCIVWNLS